MKRVKFEMKNSSVWKNGRQVFHNFFMSIYEGDCCGIICDSIEERDNILALFRGHCEVREGKIRSGDKNLGLHQNSDFFQKKASIIQKKSKLINSLSCVENICIFKSHSFFVRNSKYMKEAEGYQQYFNLELDLQKNVGELSEKDRIIVELLKAYAEKKEIIVLSDISDYLQQAELESIYQLILKLQKERISFVIMDGYGDLVFDWTNRMLVIKNQTSAGCFNTEFLSKNKLYRFLTNRDKKEQKYSLDELENEEEILQFSHLSTEKLSDISFRVGTGEILKILCLDNKSMEGIREIFWGYEKNYKGHVYLKGEKIQIKNQRDMKKKRIAYCREQAYQHMLIEDMSVRDNMMIDLSVKRIPIWFFKKYGKSIEDFLYEETGIEKLGKKVREIPHFQRQQLVFLKLYLTSPKVLICEKPFFEEDLHMKQVTKKMLELFRDSGMAVVILTESNQDLSMLEGDDLYVYKGSLIDEDAAYQIMYPM